MENREPKYYIGGLMEPTVFCQYHILTWSSTLTRPGHSSLSFATRNSAKLHKNSAKFREWRSAVRTAVSGRNSTRAAARACEHTVHDRERGKNSIAHCEAEFSTLRELRGVQKTPETERSSPPRPKPNYY